MEQIDITILGSGVIGLATAYYLIQSYPHKSLVVLEKNNRVGEEQSTHNSGVLHAGWAYTPGSLKAQLCVQGNSQLKHFAKTHHLPCKQTGKLIIAVNQPELEILKIYHHHAIQNNVPNIEFLTACELQSYEPNVHGIAALYLPTSGIIDAASYVKKLEQLVKQYEVTLLTKHHVISVTPQQNSFLLTVDSPTGTISYRTHQLINASGLNATTIGRMINPKFPYTIAPTLGEYMRFNKTTRTELNLSGLNVYPVPQLIPGMYDELGNQKYALGNHLTPTFEMQPDGSLEIGNTILVGPLTTQYNKITSFSKKSPHEFINALHPYFPSVQETDLQYDQIGIQAKIDRYSDFVIEQDSAHPNAYHILADSPGLTSSLAIATYFINNVFKR